MAADARRIKELFVAALDQSDAAARQAFLDRECAGDAELRQRLDVLLHAHDAPASALNRPLAEIAPENLPQGEGRVMPTIDTPLPTEAAGVVIAGRYKLVEQIGEGGMGTVWMAQQQEPVKRLVAVKLIKPGMDSKAVLARFEAERQALALMDHPNIAKVFDGGMASVEPSGRRDDAETRRAYAATLAGRPYFVMELVKGMPITRYCDEHHLTPRQRLELFIPVCQAVQHAHQKGIIHRDLKPSNVLIALYDGKPVPKVIDFGVAKAAGQPLTEQTLVTGFGAIVGTLEYMSPEQAEINQLDIDTRSDIYSLGVLLYELLTGSPPFSRKELEKAGMLEMLRVIREQEPSKPSTKLSTAEGLPTLAANRGTEPAKLTKLVRGELDWIVMKALEKDRNRRYETANGFAMDVQRYLADEAVQACPPSVGYRLRKFARRNKGPVLAAAMVLVALSAGIVGTTLGLVRAQNAREAETKQRELAQEKERQAVAAAAAEKTAREAAQAREEETKAVLAFVEDKVFAAARPEGQEGGLGYNVTLHQAIEAALPFVENSFQDQPLIEARLRMTLGVSFSNLGEYTTATEQVQRARALYSQHLGPDHRATLVSMRFLAECYWRLRHYTEALKLIEETLALCKAKLGDDDPITLSSMHILANCYGDLRRHPEALELREQIVALNKAKLGLDHPSTLVSMNNLANSYHGAGRHDEALELRKKTLALYRARYPAGHPHMILSIFNLARSYAIQGRRAEAAKLGEEALALATAKLGPFHPQTVQYRDALAKRYLNLGDQLQKEKDLDGAIAAYRRATELDSQDKTRIEARKRLTALRIERGDHDAAKLSQAEKHLSEGDEHVKARRLHKALESFTEVIKLQPAHTEAWFRRGNVNRALGRFEEAIADYTRHMEILGNGASHLYLAELLIDCPEQFRDPQRALKLARKGFELSSPGAWSWRVLGKAHYRAGNYQASVETLEEALASTHWLPYLRAIWLHLAMAHAQLGNLAEARGWYEKAAKWYEENNSNADRPLRAEAAEVLGGRLQDNKDLDSALAFYRKAVELGPLNAPTRKRLQALLREHGDHAEYKALLNVLKADEHLAAAEAHAAAKRWQQALASYSAAIKLHPTSAAAWHGRAKIYRALGRSEEAIADQKRVLELEPKNGGAHLYLARMLTEGPAEVRDPQLALEAARTGAKLHGPTTWAFHVLGEAEYRAGNWKESIAALEKALAGEKKPTIIVARMWLYVAMGHAQLGNVKEARGWYEKATKWHNEHPGNHNQGWLREAAALIASKEKSPPKTPSK